MLKRVIRLDAIPEVNSVVAKLGHDRLDVFALLVRYAASEIRKSSLVPVLWDNTYL
jgi:hypothetical protein